MIFVGVGVFTCAFQLLDGLGADLEVLLQKNRGTCVFMKTQELVNLNLNSKLS